MRKRRKSNAARGDRARNEPQRHRDTEKRKTEKKKIAKEARKAGNDQPFLFLISWVH
jgi:hypothetical protein